MQELNQIGVAAWAPDEEIRSICLFYLLNIKKYLTKLILLIFNLI